MKKDGDNLILHKLLFEAQNGEENYTKLDLLFYYKGMSTYLLANKYIFLSIINDIRAIIYRVFSHSNSQNILFDIIKIYEK